MAKIIRKIRMKFDEFIHGCKYKSFESSISRIIQPSVQVNGGIYSLDNIETVKYSDHKKVQKSIDYLVKEGFDFNLDDLPEDIIHSLGESGLEYELFIQISYRNSSVSHIIRWDLVEADIREYSSVLTQLLSVFGCTAMPLRLKKEMFKIGGF